MILETIPNIIMYILMNKYEKNSGDFSPIENVRRTIHFSIDDVFYGENNTGRKIK